MRWHEIFREDGRPAMSHWNLSKFGFRQDNPGGEWLEHQRERAAERGVCGGAITAYFRKDILVYSPWLHNIPGARNENRRPGEPKFDSLLAKIQEQGYDFSPDSAGLMGVDYAGNAWIIEGNTRAAVATHLGIQMIPFEIRWYAGGELADKGYDPNTVAEMIELNTNSRHND